MVKRHNPDKDVEFLTENWISVERAEDPQAWQSWLDWRRQHLRAGIEPKAFTVPTLFPPTTEAGTREVIAAILAIRGSIGWKGSKSSNQRRA